MYHGLKSYCDACTKPAPFLPRYSYPYLQLGPEKPPCSSVPRGPALENQRVFHICRAPQILMQVILLST